MTAALEASLHEILSCPRQILGRMFYEEFFSACPEAVPYFSSLNLGVQAAVLINSLQAVVACKVHRYKAVDSYLALLGNRHRRWNVPQDLFPKFRDAMLRTLAKYHGQGWNAELEQEWQEAFDLATVAMFRGYLVEHLTY